MTDTLLKMTADTSASQNRGELDKLRVYLITDRTLLPGNQFLTGIDAALKGGVRAIQLTEDVVLLTFRADIERTFGGKQTPPTVQVVEAWVRREGKWLQASYQETSVGGEPATDHVHRKR